MPLLTDPVVMNQKTSPSDADCVGPWDNAGMFPVPLPLTAVAGAAVRSVKLGPCHHACVLSGVRVLQLSAGRRRVMKELALCRQLRRQEDAWNGAYRCG